MTIASTDRCPCLSGLTYGECCGPLHAGERTAPTAVQLMRSRYSAFAVGEPEYLLATWHPSTRPSELDLDPDLRWFRLDIEATTGGGPLDSTGTVAFTARYRDADGAGALTETSTFVREGGRWLYVAGR